jgi:hypothetical protein
MGASVSDQTHDDAASTAAVEPERVVQLLAQGRLELAGQVLSTNYIFLANVEDGELKTLAIYKPRRGETPLWDFPPGTLGLREVCAYLVSQMLGWPLIPPIVLRDGPYGTGTLQLYIDADPNVHYFVLRDGRQADLLPVALFDLLINNADRKAGHLLLDRWDRIWAIDNALTFSAEPKLRTVIWDYAGQPIPQRLLDDLAEFNDHLTPHSPLSETLAKLLNEEELAALKDRLETLLHEAAFPLPDPARRQVPWPLV